MIAHRIVKQMLCLLVGLLISTSVLAAEPVKIACVGDSITFGAAIKDRENRNYPLQLGKLLGDGYVVRNYGVNGATLLKQGDLPYWTRPQFKMATDFQPDIVIIKLGTNDSKPQNWKYADQYGADLLAMIDHFQKLDSTPQIYVCRPVPVATDRWGITEAVVRDEVIPAINKAVRKAKGVKVIDLYKVLAPHPELLPDGVHPNGDGAALMAKAIYKRIK